MNAGRFLLVTAVLFFAPLAQSQINSTSSLSGTVIDSGGALVPAAAVTVQNNETGIKYVTVTAANGAFTVPSLVAGTYSVAVKMTGFKESQVSGIVLEVGVPANIQVKLEL